MTSAGDLPPLIRPGIQLFEREWEILQVWANNHALAARAERDAEIERLMKRIDYLERIHVEPEDWKVQQSMKYTHAKVTLQFKLRSEADSRSDWEHEVLSFIQQHIMDDDTPKNPIRITIEDVTK